MIAVDASALASLLLDGGATGRWVTDTLSGEDLCAPALIDYETANVIRRQEMAGAVSADQAAQAHSDLGDLAVERWPYELLAGRAWALRSNLTIYDAAYVAVAELTGAALVTLDARIAGAPGIRCTVVTP